MTLLLSVLAYSEPKDYQRTLMNEPVSLMDFMVFQNRLRLEERFDRFVAKTPGYELNLMKEIMSYKFNEFDWLVPPLDEDTMEKPRDVRILFPMYVHRLGLNFIFEEGLFEASLVMEWEMGSALEYGFAPFKRQTGRMKPTQNNMAKLCEIQLQRLSAFHVFPISHEGYTNSRLENLPDLVLPTDDVRYKVFIYPFGQMSKPGTYLTCSTTKYLLKPSESEKVNFKFLGSWHNLEKEAKKYD